MLDPDSPTPEDSIEEHRSAAILTFRRWYAGACSVAEYLEDCNLLGLVNDETYELVDDALFQMQYAMQCFAANVREEEPPPRIFRPR